MGKLINPGAGELSDRLTILSLKVLFGGLAGVDTKHWSAERGAILTQLRTKDLTGKWFEGYTELAAVNAALWHAEDDLRLLRKLPPAKRAEWAGFGLTTVEQAQELAFSIQALNDRRGELIAQINKDAGDGETREKL